MSTSPADSTEQTGTTPATLAGWGLPTGRDECLECPAGRFEAPARALIAAGFATPLHIRAVLDARIWVEGIEERAVSEVITDHWEWDLFVEVRDAWYAYVRDNPEVQAREGGDETPALAFFYTVALLFRTCGKAPVLRFLDTVLPKVTAVGSVQEDGDE